MFLFEKTERLNHDLLGSPHDPKEIAGRHTPFGVVEFTEVNPNVDIDNRTSKLTAILIHTFLSSREMVKDEIHSLA
jgi:hypothetical protein